MNKVSLLVVDDEPAFMRLLSLSLSREGFTVHTAATGEDALDLAAEIHPDAVILDLALPDVHGLDVLRDLRERTDMPVIIVTGAHTPDEVRRGLDRGADDYVTKPFSPAELAARVRAVLRRRHRSNGRTYKVGACIVDLDRRTIVATGVASIGGRNPSLGRGAWRILEALLRNEGRIMYPDELLDAAFGPAYRGDTSYLQDQVRRLRRGLGIPPWSEGEIRTVHGLGYAYDPAGELPTGAPRRPHRDQSDEPGEAERQIVAAGSTRRAPARMAG